MKNIVFVRTVIFMLVFALVCTFAGCKDNSSAISENETSSTKENITTSDTEDEIEDIEDYVTESDIQNEISEDNTNLENTYPEQTELENQVELTEENLRTTWEMFVWGRNYYITFNKSNRMTYGCMIVGTMHHEFMIDGKYSILGDEITFNYYFQGQDYIETYNIAISEEFLLLSPIENGATTLVGMYKNENYY